MEERLHDPIRKKWVKATPEEIVRQRFLQQLIHRWGFPKEIIAVEKSLKEIPHLHSLSSLPLRRMDLICFASHIHSEYPLYPLLLIECKDHFPTAQDRRQLIGYNDFVKAYFIALVGPQEIELGFFDSKNGRYQFRAQMQPYSLLIDSVKYGRFPF